MSLKFLSFDTAFGTYKNGDPYDTSFFINPGLRNIFKKLFKMFRNAHRIL